MCASCIVAVVINDCPTAKTSLVTVKLPSLFLVLATVTTTVCLSLSFGYRCTVLRRVAGITNDVPACKITLPVALCPYRAGSPRRRSPSNSDEPAELITQFIWLFLQNGLMKRNTLQVEPASNNMALPLRRSRKLGD